MRILLPVLTRIC